MTTKSNPRKRPADFAGEPAAIYCRISKAEDDDQTGVDRQERICREVADRLGLVVARDHVFMDNSRSAWQRKRKRPGWDELLGAARREDVRHIIAYHPDRLMRQPRDLEELLQVADDHRIMLHGEANRRDLSDPDDRFILRIEVAHACRSSDDTSRRLVDALEERAQDGNPHTGKRRFGYTKNGLEIVEDEATVVREIFDRYLRGESPSALARDLTERGVETAMGANWTAYSVRALIDSRHVAGIRRYRGEDIGRGNWPAIIDFGTWNEAQEKRRYRSAQYDHEGKLSRRRFYLLRGIVTCGNCGTYMSGSGTPGNWLYMCSRKLRYDAQRCQRTIAAVTLEEYVRDVALKVLENMTVEGRPQTVSLPDSQAEELEAEQQQLADLNDMWTRREIKTSEYRAMRRTIEDRIAKLQRRAIVRPVEVLEGVTGPGARAAWFAESMTDERRNAILRFLIDSVTIGPARYKGRVFDYDRVDIEPASLD
jgi:DNA invertase Pin-like site-specific DNA recombinase